MSTKFTHSKTSHSFIYSDYDLFDMVNQRVKGANTGATVLVPHVCNNVDSFGAGFAAQVAEKFPSVKEDYHLLGKTFLKNNLGYAQILKVFEDPKYKHKLYIVNMIAQNGTKSHTNPRPLNYLGLARAMLSVTQFIHNNTGFKNKSENVEIHAPKFGSGLAGGNWSFISDLIDDIWGKHFVTVYNYPPKK